MQKKNTFLIKYKQNEKFNQYWYSAKTIEFIISQIKGKCCFMSTPSIYFSITDPEIKKQCIVFDFDEKFKIKNQNNYFKYDFNHPQDIPQKYNNYFDMVIVDPPFITREVWTKYAIAVKKILRSDGRILVSTIDQNRELLDELLALKIKKYRPSIPHLVYQYSLYSNYQSEELDAINPQIGF